MNTGAVNFQSWLRNTVPGPGMSVATSAFRTPVVRPPLHDQTLELRAGSELLVKVKWVVVAGDLRVFLYIVLREGQTAGGFLSYGDVHSGSSFFRITIAVNCLFFSFYYPAYRGSQNTVTLEHGHSMLCPYSLNTAMSS